MVSGRRGVRIQIAMLALLIHGPGCQSQETGQSNDTEISALLFDRTLPASVQSLAFVGNGKECVVADENRISVLNCLDGSTIASDETDGAGYYKCVSVGDESVWVSGKQLAVRELEIRSLQAKSAIGDFDDEPSFSVLNSGASKILVGLDRKLIQYEKLTHEVVWETRTQFEPIAAVHAITDQWIAIGERALGLKYSVGLYSLSTGEKSRIEFECKKKVRGLAFAKNGGRIAIADESGRVAIFSVETGENVFSLDCDAKGAFAVTFSPDDKLLAVGCMRGAKICSIHDSKIIASWNAHEWFVNCLQFSADGKQLLSGSVDKHVKLWEVGRLVGKQTYRDW